MEDIGNSVDAGFARVDAGFARMDARFDHLQASVDKIAMCVQQVRLRRLLRRRLVAHFLPYRQMHCDDVKPAQWLPQVVSSATAADLARLAKDVPPPRLPSTHKQSCDYTARLCFALLVGQKDRVWPEVRSTADVYKNHGDDEATPFRFAMLHTMQQACDIKAGFLSYSGRAVLFLRFLDYVDGTNGHSVLLYRLGGQVHTLQSYFGVSDLACYPGDVTEALMARMLACGEPKMKVTPSSFVIEATSNAEFDVDCTQCLVCLQYLQE